MKYKIENNAIGNASSFTQGPQTPKKVLYSKIENGVLLKFDERDAEDGHFECSEITEVGNGAFGWCKALTSVNLPKVELIGKRAFFSCSSLHTLNLPEVKIIGESAFSICCALKDINLPKVEQIGNFAFMNHTSLETLSLPEVKIIDDGSFYGCGNLSSVNLPKVEQISAHAFGNCSALAIISLHQQTQIHEAAFPETLNLNYLSIEGVTKETKIEQVYENLPKNLQNQNIILNKDEQIKQLFFTKNALDITNPVSDVNNTIMDFSKRLCFFKIKESKNNGELPTEIPVLLAN